MTKHARRFDAAALAFHRCRRCSRWLCSSAGDDPARVGYSRTVGSLDLTKIGPALRAAVNALAEASDALEAAKARFAADDAKVSEWCENNPEPEKGRARKRWVRKWLKFQDATAGESSAAQMEAEANFRKAQMTVGQIKPADLNELVGMAAVAAMYDKTMLASYDQSAVISYGVAMSLVRLQA